METGRNLLCHHQSSYGTLKVKEASVVDIRPRQERIQSCSDGKRMLAFVIIVCMFLLKDTVLNFYKEEPWPDIPPEVKLSLAVIEDATSVSKQAEALFLSIGFLLTAVVLTLVDLSTTFILGSIMTAASLTLILVLDEPLVDCATSSLTFSLVSMASVLAVVILLKEKRLASLSLVMSLSYIGELLMKPVSESLLASVGYDVAAGVLIGSVAILSLAASILTRPANITQPHHDQITALVKMKSLAPKIYIISPNIVGSFLFSCAVSNIYTHYVPANASLSMINLSIVLGLSLAGFVSERKALHPCTMLISVTLLSSLVTTFLVIYQTKEAYYTLNFLVGFCLASVTYTLVSLVSWTHLASMMSLMSAVRCLGYVAAPALASLLDQDKIDPGFISVGAMLLSSGVYGLIAKYRVKEIAEGYQILEKS